MCCQAVCPGIQSTSIEDNFTAAHFQAFVFPAAATPDTRAPAATNFLPHSLFLLSPSICVSVCVCVRDSVVMCVPTFQVSHLTSWPAACQGESDTTSSGISFTCLTLSIFLPLSLYPGLIGWSSPAVPPRLSSLPVFVVTLFHSPPPFPSLSCCLWFCCVFPSPFPSVSIFNLSLAPTSHLWLCKMIRKEKGGGNVVEPRDEGEAEGGKKGEQGRWWHMGRCIKVVEG